MGTSLIVKNHSSEFDTEETHRDDLRNSHNGGGKPQYSIENGILFSR